MRADGTTVDEPYHLSYGERALFGDSLFRETDLMNSKMPVSALSAASVAVASRFQTLDWPRRLWLARLPTVVLGILLGAVVWRWAGTLFGVWAGALALLLYTFCPNMLAHSHLVTTEVATSLGMFASAYSFWRYLSAPSRGRLLLAAATCGVAPHLCGDPGTAIRARGPGLLAEAWSRDQVAPACALQARAWRLGSVDGPWRRRRGGPQHRLSMRRQPHPSEGLQVRQQELPDARRGTRAAGRSPASSLPVPPGNRHGRAGRLGSELELSPWHLQPERLSQLLPIGAPGQGPLRDTVAARTRRLALGLRARPSRGR